MTRLVAIAVGLCIAVGALASGNARTTVDLRYPGALHQLQKSDPAAYGKIRKALAGLEQQPARVEGDWLQVTFDARDVEVSGLLLETSYPPKQLLQFTLDDVRYIVHVLRSDLVAGATPAM